MNRAAADVQESVQERVPSSLPADHVLHSAAVLFPGTFDQHGCPLIVFPADEQAKLCSSLSKAEVVDFINYFLCLHNKKQEKDSLVSVVADLRHASLPTTRFITETLLLLELHRRTVHCVYIIQPRKKDAVRLLLKLLFPSKSYAASFKKVLLKEVSELSNYIDRSQLTASLGGYFMYCHQSWVAFVKEVSGFVQEFLSVVQRLPSCISTLQALSRLPLPSTFSELQHFCSTNEAKFKQLRRELGLDELLRRCETVVEKLRYPEREPSYQAMAGTALFTHTTFDMLQNHSRITAAVEKVELLWQQAFAKAHLQLQVFQLREDGLQITELIRILLEEKLQPYKIEIAKDAAKAAMLVSQFEESIHSPAMALIGCAEDVIQSVAEILVLDGNTREHWVLNLQRLKDKLHSAVLFILQTLRAVSSYHHFYNKASSWYRLVLCENFLPVVQSGGNADGVPTHRQRKNWGTIPAWRYKLSTFLKENPPPDTEELVHLAHLSNAVPDEEVQAAGRQMSQRCLTLRKLLMSSGPVAVGHLQLALQWLYELLRSSHENPSFSDSAANRTAKDVQHLPKCESGTEAARLLGTSPSSAVSGTVSAEDKPMSLSSVDSGFDGAGNSRPEARGGREGMEDLSRFTATRDSVRPAVSPPPIHIEEISSVSDCGDHRDEFDLGSLGNSSGASIQVIPKVTADSLNLEIKVKRSAAPPNNPWLSLPVDNLENSYTVTITQNPTPQKRERQSYNPSEPCTQSNRSRDQPTQTEVLSGTQRREPQSRVQVTRSQSSLEDPELSPIRNILSSTITDEGDKSICTTEGVPTLTWDSYDLHDQNQDAVDGSMDLSLNDWDVKEQEDLMEVEKMLGRAGEILEKEENVLAQEAVLDALLRSADRRSQWPAWSTEDQHSVMSYSELAEAGVLGLEDYLDPAESDLSEPKSTRSESGPEASKDTRRSAEGAATTAADLLHSRPDLLTELRKVHVLDELIVEENLKIHELRRSEANAEEEPKPPDANGPLGLSKEAEAFRFQLEKEKREVEKLERSLDEERKVKKHKDRARKVVKCSIMRKGRSEDKEDKALCDELLSRSYKRSQRAHSTSLIQSKAQAQETCRTGNTQDNVLEEATPQDSVQLPDVKAPPGEVGTTPQGCIRGRESDGPDESASVTSETRPDDGVFDPGREPRLPPVPKPRKASLPVNDDLAERQNLAHSSVARDLGQLDLRDEWLEALPENVTPYVRLQDEPLEAPPENGTPAVRLQDDPIEALPENPTPAIRLQEEYLEAPPENPTPAVRLQDDPIEAPPENGTPAVHLQDERLEAPPENGAPAFRLQDNLHEAPPENWTPAVRLQDDPLEAPPENVTPAVHLQDKLLEALPENGTPAVRLQDNLHEAPPENWTPAVRLQDDPLEAPPENVTPAVHLQDKLLEAPPENWTPAVRLQAESLEALPENWTPAMCLQDEPLEALAKNGTPAVRLQDEWLEALPENGTPALRLQDELLEAPPENGTPAVRLQDDPLEAPPENGTPGIRLQDDPLEELPKNWTPAVRLQDDPLEAPPENWTPVVRLQDDPLEAQPENMTPGIRLQDERLEASPENWTPAVRLQDEPLEAPPENWTPAVRLQDDPLEAPPENGTPAVRLQDDPLEASPENGTPAVRLQDDPLEASPENVTPVVRLQDDPLEAPPENGTPAVRLQDDPLEASPENGTPAGRLQDEPLEALPENGTPAGRLQDDPLEALPENGTPAGRLQDEALEALPENGTPAVRLQDEALPETVTPAVRLQDDPLEALPENMTPAVRLVSTLNPNVKEHSNNNNNNRALTETCGATWDRLSDVTTEEEDESVAPARSLQTDLDLCLADEVRTLPPADERQHQPSPPRLPPERAKDDDPGGRDEQEDVADGAQSSWAMRTSGCGSAGTQNQNQLSVNTRELQLTDFKTPIVLDTGSGLMKAGFADQDLPSTIFPTIIGTPKYEGIMHDNLEREIYIGHEAQHMRGVLALKHPIKNGAVRNWDDMEKIWHHTFQQLCVDPGDHPVLLTEAAMNPLMNRQRMVEIMFECFGVPCTYVAMQAVLALYAAGRSTGVVFDSGDGVSHSVPVFEGYCLPHAVQRFPLAGVDVTMHLKKLLQEQGVSMRTTAEVEIVREMKEKCCCVAVDYEAALSQRGASCREMHYTMPDGQTVTLGTERFRAPEILFKPELIGRDHYGMHESVFKSILSSDIDLRRCLLGNIVLSGGNTLLPGLPERLQAEIKGLLPRDTGASVRVTSPEDRDFSVWRGGAVLASLPTFGPTWISQEEYEEYGSQIALMKCF